MTERLASNRQARAFRIAAVALAALVAPVTVSSEGGAGPSDSAKVQHFEAAERAIVPLAGDPGTIPDEPPPPHASPAWRRVELPDIVVRRVIGEPGSGTDVLRPRMIWYRVAWHHPPRDGPRSRPLLGQDDAVVLYVPRAVAMSLQVWCEDGAGRWSRLFDNDAHWREQWNRPLLITIPEDLLRRDSALTLAVGFPSFPGRSHGLSSLWIGPLADLQRRADARTVLQQALPEAASLAMATLGAMAFGVWLRRRGERAYLYFALASVLWPFRNLHYFVDFPRDRDTLDWFWWLSNASLAWVMFTVYLFAFRFDARRYPKVERAFGAFVVAAALVTLPSWGDGQLLVQHAANALAALFATGLLSVLALRGGSRELRAIVATLWACLAFGIHDWLLLSLQISPESIYLLPYGSVLVIGSFLHAALRRFVGAIEQVETANVVLARTLRARERELDINHERLRHIEREQAVLLERQRLMRDMHDGLGATLVTTLRVVEHGDIGREALADVLRLAVEDLRVMIDSLEPVERDLTTLLATLRLRMGRRLEAAGLQLRWQMDDLPPLQWLDATQALQILRLLQEALANVIKHAHARSIAISASIVGSGAVLVRVDDDGAGFDPRAAGGQGRGIDNMRERARLLGGTLDIASAVGAGTRLALRLPVADEPAPP